MKKMALGLLLLAVSVGSAQDSSTHSDTERTLLKMEDEWAQVDISGDMTVLERTLANDFVGTGRTGRIADKKQFIAEFEMEGVTSVRNSDMKVHIYADNVVVVNGIDNTEGRDKNGRNFRHRDRFTDTYVKRDGAWKCVAAQVTRIE